MADITNAQPSDLFQDTNGNMWIVIGRCDVPVIYMERVPLPGQLAKGAQKGKRDGGITGDMWNGFFKVGHLQNPNSNTDIQSIPDNKSGE